MTATVIKSSSHDAKDHQAGHGGKKQNEDVFKLEPRGCRFGLTGFGAEIQVVYGSRFGRKN